MRRATRSVLSPLLFLIYVNGMSMAAKCTLFLYADDICLVFQSKNVKVIEKSNENFANICDWFVDNKLSIHFGEDTTKSIQQVNARLKFLHRKNKYLTPNLCCLLCNALIQPHFANQMHSFLSTVR